MPEASLNVKVTVPAAWPLAPLRSHVTVVSTSAAGVENCFAIPLST